MKIIIRLSLYIILIGSFSFAIHLRFVEIKKEKNLVLNSFPDFYRKNGIPVKVYKVVKKDLVLNKKLSAYVTGIKELEAKVGEDIKNQLSVGDTFESEYMKELLSGKVNYISSSRSYTDGLFLIKFVTSKKISFKEGLVPLTVQIGKIKQALIVPNTALMPQGSKFYVWTSHKV